MRKVNAIEGKRKKNGKRGSFLHFIILLLEGGKKATDDVAAFVSKLGSSVGVAGWRSLKPGANPLLSHLLIRINRLP